MELFISLIICLGDIWGLDFKKNTRYRIEKNGAKKCKKTCLKVLTLKNKDAIIKLHRVDGGGVSFFDMAKWILLKR